MELTLFNRGDITRNTAVVFVSKDKVLDVAACRANSKKGKEEYYKEHIIPQVQEDATIVFSFYPISQLSFN